MAARAILITGATGKQGSSVINALLNAKANFEILALTRNAQSSSAQRLLQKSPKIKLITGNLDAPDDVFRKAKEVTKLPIWGVFSVQVAIGNGASAQSEERQGKAIIDASLNNGVKYFLYTSADRGGARSDNDSTNVPHFISKYNIEQHLITKAKGSEMSWTILRPVAFFENMTPDFVGKVFTTIYDMTLRRERKLQFVATSDIGFFAAQAFLKPEEWKNKSLAIAGDDLAFDEFKQTFEQTTSQKLPMTYRFIAAPINWMVKELGYMFKWFDDVGFGADIESLRKMNPELKNFKDWLETESAWKTR